MYGYVYRITNNINGKIYIGQKKSSIIVESYWGSGKLIQAAIAKYGKEHFTRDILEWCSSKEELDKQEIFWIAELRACELGYNMCSGGGGALNYHHTEETKRKIALRIPDRSGENNPMFGVHRFGETAPRYGAVLEQQTKDKISQSLLRHYETSGGVADETKAKLHDVLKGKSKTIEHKQKISSALKGKSKTVEHRAKMSEAAKKRVLHNTCLNCGEIFEARGWKQKYCEACVELRSNE